MNILGLIISFAYIFLVIGITTVLKKRLDFSEEISRKIIHIFVSNWILIALVFFDSVWYAAVAPVCFVFINWISNKKGTFSAMERSDNSSLGTVWYAVSLLIAVVFSYAVGKPYLAACGILSMGYGDGFAAIIGKKYGKHKFPVPFSHKTAEGSGAVFFGTVISVYLVLSCFGTTGATFSTAIVCGLIAMIVEAISPNSIDNLTVPIIVMLFAFSMDGYAELLPFLINIAITAAIVFAAWCVSSITIRAALSAFVLGVSLFFFGGDVIYWTLIEFFVLGSTISKFKKKDKSCAEKLHHRQGSRTSVQVLANGLPVLLFCIAYYFIENNAFLLVAFSCLAAASADTFSSEIGMTSKKNPVSIMTFKPIQKGISGGVTTLGMASGLLGSMLIALMAFIYFGVYGFLVVIFFGFIGSLFDSVLGATLQAKYKLPDEGGLTERSEMHNKKLAISSGFAFVNNDIVNFISILFSGLACLLFSLN